MNLIKDSYSYWLVAIFLCVLMLLIPLLSDSLSSLLSYQRESIVTAEYWRLISAHFVHLNANHLFLNCLGLLLVWLIVGDRFKPLEWILLVIVIGLTSSLCLLFFNPEILNYVGFSGLLHGLLVAGILKHTESYQDVILLIIVTLKLVYEQIYGPIEGSEVLIESSVIVDAHLYGALAGLVYSLLRRGVLKQRL